MTTFWPSCDQRGYPRRAKIRRFCFCPVRSWIQTPCLGCCKIVPDVQVGHVPPVGGDRSIRKALVDRSPFSRIRIDGDDAHEGFFATLGRPGHVGGADDEFPDAYVSGWHGLIIFPYERRRLRYRRRDLSPPVDGASCRAACAGRRTTRPVPTVTRPIAAAATTIRISSGTRHHVQHSMCQSCDGWRGSGSHCIGRSDRERRANQGIGECGGDSGLGGRGG